MDEGEFYRQKQRPCRPQHKPSGAHSMVLHMVFVSITCPRLICDCSLLLANKHRLP
jgi:hypothetical protein